jgi:hypothetical protein
VAGEQHELGAGMLAAHLLEQVQARGTLELEVGEHEVGGRALEGGEGLAGAGAALDVGQPFERTAGELPVEAVVVHDDDAGTPGLVRHPPSVEDDGGSDSLHRPRDPTA